MADIKWIKLTANMHEDEKMKLMDAMPGRDTNHYLWIRLLVQAGKTNSNGFIFLSENIPYTDEMLATIFNRPLESIKLALKTLSDFEMIEVAPNNIIKIVNWDKHQNIEGMERVRAQNRKRAETHRDKKKQIETTTEENHEEVKQNNDDVNVQDNYDADVQEDQRENSNVRVGDNKNIVPLDNAAENPKVNIEDDGNDTENASEGFITNKNSNSSSGIAKNSCNVTEDSCNVTKNESNVIVTEQNKRESKNKKENKREIESNKLVDINNKGSTQDEDLKKSGLSQEVKESIIPKNKNLKEKPIAIAENDINSNAIELMTYYEKITGVIGGLNHVALRLAIDMHGKNHVKMAIDKALEVNQTDMRYINGILKNWRREGYPKDDMEVKTNGARSTGKNNSADKNEFTGFKPKKPRNLTKDERKGTEENLI